MEPALRLLGSDPFGLLLLGGAVLGALACTLAGAIGLRRLDAPGNPRKAILVSVLLTLPLLLPIGGALLAVPDAGSGDPRLAATIALQVRLFAGAAGLLLALPVGLSSLLWAGIAAARRVRQAGERARLSAVTTGQSQVGIELAAALERTGLPPLALGIGLLAALLPIGAPSLALYLAGARGLEDLALADALGGSGGSLVGTLQAQAAGEILRAGAWTGAAGALAVSLLVGLFLHAGSSRRRNYLVAMRAAGCSKDTRASVARVLEASGKPGALGPLALALLLLALSVWIWIQVLDLHAEAVDASEALALPAGGRSYPQGPPGAALAADRSAATMAGDALAHLP